MGDFMFVVKCLVITVILVFVMQIKIGENTLEQHSVDWIHHSSLIDNLQPVADGAIRATRQGYRWASDFFDTKMNERARPGTRLQTIQVKRSEAAAREMERKRNEKEKMAIEAARSEVNGAAKSPASGAEAEQPSAE